MSEVVVRLIIVLALSLSILGFVWVSHRIIKRKRYQASSADPLLTSKELGGAGAISPTRVRILAFASEDCHQCHTLQAPVLRRVKQAHGDIITIINIDAP